MLKTPKYAVPLCAVAVGCLLAASSVSIAANARFPESGKGRQSGPTIMGDKTAARKSPTHSMGAVTQQNPNGPLRGPAIRESGMGRLAGGEKQGDKNTPRKAPTASVTPR